MKFILILWLVTRGDGMFAENLGGIESAEFRSQETCEAALKTVVERAKYINGACVAQ